MDRVGNMAHITNMIHTANFTRVSTVTDMAGGGFRLHLHLCTFTVVDIICKRVARLDIITSPITTRMDSK